MISLIKKYKEAVISAVALAAALLTEHGFILDGSPPVYLTLYAVSYLAVGGPVWIKAFQSLRNGVLFGDCFLWGIATGGDLRRGDGAGGVGARGFDWMG